MAGGNPAQLRRGLLAATWLAGTLLATGIVYEAVNVVAGQVTAQSPGPISQSAIGQALAHPGTTSSSPSPSASAATPSAPTPSPTLPPSTAPESGNGGHQTASPPAGASANTRTFSLVGGTASLSCTNGQIALNWATPNPGFQVEIGSSDSGTQIEVRFRSDSHDSRLEAWCSGDQVQGTVQEGSS